MKGKLALVKQLVETMSRLSPPAHFGTPPSLHVTTTLSGLVAIHMKKDKRLNLNSDTVRYLSKSIGRPVRLYTSRDEVIFVVAPEHSPIAIASQLNPKTDIMTFCRAIEQQADSVRELVTYAIAMLLVDYSQAEMLDSCQAKSQQWLTLQMGTGEVCKIVKPAITQETTETLSALAHRVLETYVRKTDSIDAQREGPT